MDVIQSGHAADRLRDELASIVRFVLVGLLNTAIGYGVILLALVLGLGDYLANLTGFLFGVPAAYLLHRRWTFRAATRRSTGEMALYAVCFTIAYAANLGVISAGRQAGYEENALVQLAAIGVYAAILYVLTRLIVFRGTAAASPRHRG
jgi:putative flippase GtrA